MSRARFHFQSRLRRSFRAWPHGVAHSWGSASLHPRLLSGAPSALERRSCKTQTLPPRLSCQKKVTILEGCFSAVAAILNSAWDLGERARRTITRDRPLMLQRLLLMRPSENAKHLTEDSIDE